MTETTSNGREGWSQEDYHLLTCFGGSDTALVDVPHVMLTCAEPVIDEVARMLGCKPGLWPERVVYDQEGVEKYLDLLAGEATFSDWATDLNQAALRQLCRGHGLGRFRMCIDCRADIEKVEPLWDGDRLDNMDLVELTNRVPMIIEDIGWAYVILDDDFPASVFVTKPSWARYVDELCAWARKNRRPYATLEREGGRAIWRFGGGKEETLLEELDRLDRGG